jgi:predicted Zn finger-like uncharacterized protein
MYTQCPQCLTIFAIDEDALQASLGIVHCGQCGQRFDALRTLSNSLPAERDAPLTERDAGQRVPTLTQAVPPAVQSAAPTERHQDDAAPAAATEASGADGPSAPPASGDAVVPAPVPTDTGSDWFADFENELTTSLLSEATPAASSEGMIDYTWQVDELPAQAPFAAPDVSTIFWGSGAELDVFEAMAAEEPARQASDDRDVPGPVEPVAPVWPAAAPPGFPEIAGANTDPPAIEEPVDPVVPPPAQSPADAAAPDASRTPGPDVATDAAPRAGRGEAPRADQLLAHDASEQAAAAETDDAEIDAAESDAVETDAVETGDAEATEATLESGDTTPTDVVSDPAEPLTPVYVRPRGRRMAGVAWALGCLVLALVLAAQLAWIKRVDLFRDPATHPWVARACQVIACRLPPIRAASKLALVSRDVRPDPHTSGALMITATVRNDADFRQPWPVVVVELTDLDNNVVAMRRFRPAEYMPDAARRAAGIAAGATSAVAFEVADPGRRAVAFRFSFE